MRLPPLLLLVACAANPGGASRLDRVPSGEWGGEHARLTVADGGGKVEFDCAHGALRRARDPELGEWAIRRGTTAYGVATAANVFAGMLFLLALPRSVLVRLAGADTWAMTLLAVGILLAIATAGTALLALGVKSPVPATWTQVGLLAATLVVMVLLRDQVRATIGRARTGRSRPTRTPWI